MFDTARKFISRDDMQERKQVPATSSGTTSALTQERGCSHTGLRAAEARDSSLAGDGRSRFIVARAEAGLPGAPETERAKGIQKEQVCLTQSCGTC